MDGLISVFTNLRILKPELQSHQDQLELHRKTVPIKKNKKPKNQNIDRGSFEVALCPGSLFSLLHVPHLVSSEHPVLVQLYY